MSTWRWHDGLTPQPDAVRRLAGSPGPFRVAWFLARNGVNFWGLAWPAGTIVLVKMLVEAM